MRGARVLAWADVDNGSGGAGRVEGTRDTLLLPGPDGGVRLPWERVQAAEWDDDDGVLVVSEVGDWGARRPEHRLALVEPGRLLQLVRERITASVVLVRHVPLADVAGARGGGMRVIARQAPGERTGLTWFYEYDEGVDPTAPDVAEAAAAALAAARAEIEPG